METIRKREAWNKGKLVGQKPPLKPKDIWAIRIHLQNAHAVRDLAMFNLAIYSKAILLGRNDRDKPQVKRQLAGVVSFVGPIHQQVNRPGCRAEAIEKFTSFRRVVRVAGRKREGNCR